MKNQALLYGIIGFLVGSLLTILVSASVVNNNNTSMMRMMGMQPHMQMMEEEVGDAHSMHGMDSMNSSMTMDGMVSSLKGKSGDELDKAFINAMIPHHQGAIDMAKEIKDTAKHQELRTLAEEIISAQEKEIGQMRQWMKEWGY